MECDMQTTGILYQQSVIGVSVLKTANQQPQLAGDLIVQAVENMRNQAAQTPIQPADISGIPVTGNIINTTA
jgi:hypothetical protein